MGKIVRASFSEIYPGEELVHKRILAEIIKTAKSQPLFIIPVKISKGGKYINLDGRHRLVYHRLIGEKGVDLFVAQNPTDFITEQEYVHPNFSKRLENNQNINKRWDCVESDDRHSFMAAPYNNFEKYFIMLCKIMPFLNNFETCINCLKEEGYLERNFRAR